MVKLFIERIRTAEGRKLFGGLLLAKATALALLFFGIKSFGYFLGGPAQAAGVPGATDVPIGDVVNGLNTAWVLIAAFLVFFMQAGFMMLEVGFARSRETVNILLECIADTCLCGLLFWAFGFAFMFGHGNGIIGHEFFFLNGAEATYTYHGTFDTGVAFMAFFLFQFAFADTCSTITSGAMVGRTAFKGDLIYSFAVSGFIYPIIGHWAWGPGGWLATMSTPFRDFAGSTVVHTVGGMVALTGAIALGPRLGRRFKRDGGGLFPGHDMTIAAIGGVVLWFGWYGFNPGSTLSAMDASGIGRVATNTTLAACAGGLSAMFWIYPRIKTWDTGITVNGFLAGLVGITAGCYWVNPLGAVIIGAIAGVIMIYAVDVIEWFRIDDPIGAVAVHGFCGIWGTIAVGLFATGQYGVDGLFWGGDGAKQLGIQVLGSAVVTVVALAAGFALMFGIKRFGLLRVSEAGELEGIDIHEHGGPAYHLEFGTMGYAPSSTNDSN